jgi:hypothetical protein
VLEGAAEAVEPPRDEDVAGAQEAEEVLQHGSAFSTDRGVIGT